MTVLERVGTPRGELVLRCVDDHLEVISNGMFLMDTRDGRSERLLVRAAVEGRPGPLRVLVGGLGVGFSLVEALHHPAVASVTVVEVEPAVVRWHATHLAAYSAGALDDPRVTVVVADLVTWLRATRERYDALCLDIDNGPEWTVTGQNAVLYDDEGLALVRSRLRAGGVAAFWSANAVPAFERRLRERLGDVTVLTVDVARGEPDVVYSCRVRRRPARQAADERQAADARRL